MVKELNGILSPTRQFTGHLVYLAKIARCIEYRRLCAIVFLGKKWRNKHSLPPVCHVACSVKNLHDMALFALIQDRPNTSA